MSGSIGRNGRSQVELFCHLLVRDAHGLQYLFACKNGMGSRGIDIYRGDRDARLMGGCLGGRRPRFQKLENSPGWNAQAMQAREMYAYL